MSGRRERLYKRRVELGLTQEGIALAIGVATSTYKAWEAGTSKPRPGGRRPLAAALEWSLVQLDEALNGHRPTGRTAVYGTTDRFALLLRNLAALVEREPDETFADGDVQAAASYLAQQLNTRLARGDG